MALAKSQQSLKKWTAQKWKTSDGKPSKGKKRYLPAAAWEALSPAEKAATNRARGDWKRSEKVRITNVEAPRYGVYYREDLGLPAQSLNTSLVYNKYANSASNSSINMGSYYTPSYMDYKKDSEESYQKKQWRELS